MLPYQPHSPVHPAHGHLSPCRLPCLALGRPYYLMRQKHPGLPACLPQQQVLVLAEPKRKPSTFWHSISRLAPFRK